MDTREYIVAWLIYLLSALAVSIITWGVLRKYLLRELAFLLQCVLVALLFTPWYVEPGGEIMAPAFIIFLMDSITMDPTAGIRSLIPLVMTLLASVLLAIILSVVSRIAGRKKSTGRRANV